MRPRTPPPCPYQVRVLGKNTPVRIYELICRAGEEEAALSEDMRRSFVEYREGLAKFRARRFDDARLHFQRARAARKAAGRADDKVRRPRFAAALPAPSTI